MFTVSENSQNIPNQLVTIHLHTVFDLYTRCKLVLFTLESFAIKE